VQTIAPAGTSFRALDVKVNFLRAVVADGEDLVATGTVMHRGRRLSIAGAEVMHGGQRVALATGTTAVFPA
jgi:acyl-CoA thioesterase